MNVSRKAITIVLILLKALMSALIFIFPQFADIVCPFAVFTPMFLFTFAYPGGSEWSALILMVVIVGAIAIAIVCPVLLLVKSHWTGGITAVLQILFMIEILSLLASIFFGGSFIKICGVILNVFIADSLIEIRHREVIHYQ